MEKFFAATTSLSPNINVGGKSYSVGIKLKDPYSNRTDRPLIVQGQVESIDDLGNTKKITCARENKYCSYTQSFGGGDSVEVVYPVLCGNSVAACEEPLRVFCFAEPTATRGSDARTHAIPGDVLEIPETGKRYLIQDAQAYDSAPAAVAWQGTEYLPTNTYIENGIAPVMLDTYEGESVLIDGEGELSGLQVVIPSGGGEYVLARKIFGASGNESWFPFDAKFDAGQYQYFVDPITYAIRLSSNDYYINNSNDETVKARYWKTTGISGEVGEFRCAVSSSNVAYASGIGQKDGLYAAQFPTYDDFSKEFAVYGATVEWRVYASGNPRYSPVLTCSPFLGGYRSEYGGAFTQSGTLPAYTNPYLVKVEKNGGNVTISHKQNVYDGYTTGLIYSFPNVAQYTYGNIGFAGSGWSEIVTTEPHVTFYNLGASGCGAIYCEDVFAAKFSQAFTLPEPTAITSVYNLSTDSEMVNVSISGVSRNGYATTGSQVVLYSEGGGDHVRLTQAAKTGTPDVPGRLPRVFGIDNAVDPSGDVSKSRLHWRDTLTIYAPDFPYEEGQSFFVYRDPLFDPANPPVLEYVFRGDTNWTTVPSGDVLSDWGNQVLLVSNDFVSSAPSGLCFRLSGEMFRQSCGLNETLYNDAARAIECLDNTWAVAGQPGSITTGFYGGHEILDVHPTTYTMNGGNIVPDGVAFGTTKASVAAKNEVWRGANAIAPGWNDEYSIVVPDTRVYGWRQWRTGTNGLYTEDVASGHEYDCITDECYMEVEPREAPSCFLGSVGTYPDEGPLAFSTGFGIQSYPFLFSGLLARLAGLGATILEGRLAVKVTGGQYAVWSKSYCKQDDGNFTFYYIWNGTTLQGYESVNGVLTVQINNPQTWADGAYLNFGLVGRRRRTGTIFLWNNPALPAPVDSHIYKHFSGGITTQYLPNGVWSYIDVTGLMNGALLAAKSDCADLFLFPNLGLEPGASTDDMTGYLESLMPSYAITAFYGGASSTELSMNYAGETSGRYTTYDSLTLGNLFLRYQLPDTLVETMTIPLTLPAIPY